MMATLAAVTFFGLQVVIRILSPGFRRRCPSGSTALRAARSCYLVASSARAGAPTCQGRDSTSFGLAFYVALEFGSFVSVDLGFHHPSHPLSAMPPSFGAAVFAGRFVRRLWYYWWAYP